MAWGEDEAISPDMASVGLHVLERIDRDAATQPDLEEALEASRYASHPYSRPLFFSGAEPKQLAFSAALGITIGIFPVQPHPSLSKEMDTTVDSSHLHLPNPKIILTKRRI
ncbi:hypothetical protein Zm00014a_026525 [Zea mays]|uniref:Nuclear pore complex protein NUP155 n=1 Tax=Zea mays TaxID=4577 RepID=A0A3L6DMG9_MAIZE|nr:hypothetical protein Zm00014a_026525 [Zea mays]PWZ09813.1 Nuclear pore complex protein NUP155 [Zea mays]PWZ09814.1 hypothetical protein Zm00014a_026525 [Zea mays]PWZ09815.1 hypothetical protein Zm00014a_026525 [Zea mays]